MYDYDHDNQLWASCMPAHAALDPSGCDRKARQVAVPSVLLLGGLTGNADRHRTYPLRKAGIESMTPNQPKISVALATYNGSRFLAEQLGSIRDQSVRPHELIISDDASIDNTLQVARTFAQAAPFAVHLIQNANNLGYSRNFERALERCTGDVVLISDQDDVWMPDKVARLQEERLEHPEALLIMSDAEIVDQDGIGTGETVLGNMRKLGYGSEKFVKGCCMAVDRSLLDVALPLSDETAYDSWISTLAQRLQAKRVINDVLLQYRSHDENTSAFLTRERGPSNRGDRAMREVGVDPRGHLEARVVKVEAVKTRLQQRASSPPRPLTAAQFEHALAATEEELSAVADRADLLQKARLRRALPATRLFLGGSYRHFSGAASYAKDLLRR